MWMNSFGEHLCWRIFLWAQLWEAFFYKYYYIHQLHSELFFTSALEFFDKVNKHITQDPRMQYVYASAYLCFSVCVCWRMFMCLCMRMCVCVQTVWVGVCVWGGGWGCVCVCVWILNAHKKKKKSSWDESGAAHVETLWAETVSMRSIMRQGWALMWLLSSPPIGSSVCVYVCVSVCARRRASELRRSRSISPFVPLFASSLKKYPKTTNWLRRASRWAQSLRRIGGPPPLALSPSLPSPLSGLVQPWRSYHKSPGVFRVTMSAARGQGVAEKGGGVRCLCAGRNCEADFVASVR